MRLTPPASGLRRSLAAGAITAAAAVALTAPSAHAAFTLPSCGSSAAIKGQGSSFQTLAQQYWAGLYGTSAGCDGKTAPTYNPNGSGNGNAAMGAGGGNATLNCATATPACTVPLAAGLRDATTRFSGSDEAPTATQLSAINAGSTTTSADDGVLHTIPAALGAAAFIVRLPDGCTVPAASLTGGTDGTGDTATTGQRVKIPNTLIEQAFAAQISTWGDLVPGITGTGCATAPIVRVVRQDSSGTTLAFKTFLTQINPNRGWLTTYQGGTPLWPKSSSDPTATAPTATTGTSACPTGVTLCSSASGNGTNLAKTEFNTPGSIGYVALSDARANGFDLSGPTDTTYWSPVQNLSNGTYVEPTLDPTAHLTSSTGRGSACASTPINNIPTGADPTLASWSNTTAVGNSSYTGYPACVLTYELAWDDNAPVYGNTSAEEANARVVKDYLTKVVVSSAGQSLTGTDYSKLPANLLTIAQNGVNAIDWNKSASASTPPGGGTTPTPTPAPAPAPGPGITPVPTAPSNAFSLTSSSSKSSSSSSSLTFSIQLPGAGALSAKSTYKSGGKSKSAGSASAAIKSAGTAKVTIKLSSAARAALKKAKSKKLSISTVITFTPTGGSAKSVTKTLSVKAPATKKKSTKKKK